MRVRAAGTGDDGHPAAEVERGGGHGEDDVTSGAVSSWPLRSCVIAAPAQAAAQSTLVKVPMMNRSVVAAAGRGVPRRSG